MASQCCTTQIVKIWGGSIVGKELGDKRAFVVTNHIMQQVAQLSQRDRAAGCIIVCAKNRRLEVGDNILRTL